MERFHFLKNCSGRWSLQKIDWFNIPNLELRHEKLQPCSRPVTSLNPWQVLTKSHFLLHVPFLRHVKGYLTSNAGGEDVYTESRSLTNTKKAFILPLNVLNFPSDLCRNRRRCIPKLIGGQAFLSRCFILTIFCYYLSWQPGGNCQLGKNSALPLMTDLFI